MALIAGDIGGTKTNLAVYTQECDPRLPLVEATFPSDDYPNLTAMLKEFMSRVNLEVEMAAFGIAGPVVDEQVRTTNLPWEIDAAALKHAFDFTKVWLLNDLEAIANAVPILQESDLVPINPREVESEGAIAIIAPGTGLGEAYLTWDGQAYRAHPSEGGHVDFAPADLGQLELLRFLKGRFEHVSFERVCSGSGIPNIYAFYKESGYAEEPAWLRRQLAEAEDPTPIIARAGLDPELSCELCAVTMDTFVSILGSEAGNLALKVLATGGVYLGGGIPPKILNKLMDGTFMAAFTRKGRFADFLNHLNVAVILNDKAALFGAALFGLRRMPELEPPIK